MFVWVAKLLGEPTCEKCKHFKPEVFDHIGLGYGEPDFCCYYQRDLSNSADMICDGEHYEPGRYTDYYYVDGTPLKKNK